MLTTNTQKVISQLLDITPKMIVSYPITGLKDEDKTIFAFIDMTKLGEEEFKEFGLLKTKEFIDLLKIAGEDAIYTYDGRRNISIESKTVKCRYLSSYVDSLEDTCRTNPKMIANVDASEKAMSFTFSNQELSQIKSVANLLNFDDLVLESNSNGVTITAKNYKEKEGNDFSLSLDGESYIDTSIMMSVTNLKKLPSGNYNVIVAKGANYAIKFESENIPGLVIIMPTKAFQK